MFCLGLWLLNCCGGFGCFRFGFLVEWVFCVCWCIDFLVVGLVQVWISWCFRLRWRLLRLLFGLFGVRFDADRVCGLLFW